VSRKRSPVPSMRAVSTFLSSSTGAKPESTVSLESICFSPNQPRRYFDASKMAQLVASVKEHGIIEPLLVRPLPDNKYELVAGERRYRAAKEVGLDVVPIVIRELNDEEALQLALVENLQREDLNPVEETEGAIALLSMKLQLPVDEVPQLLHRLAKSSDNVVGSKEKIQIIESVFQVIGRMTWESFSTHRLPLLNLPLDVLEALREGRIAYTKARAIARLKDEEVRSKLLDEAVEESLSLNQIKDRAKELMPVSEETSPGQEPNLKQRFSKASSALKKSGAWRDSKKIKRIEKLIQQLEALAEE